MQPNLHLAMTNSQLKLIGSLDLLRGQGPFPALVHSQSNFHTRKVMKKSTRPKSRLDNTQVPGPDRLKFEWQHRRVFYFFVSFWVPSNILAGGGLATSLVSMRRSVEMEKKIFGYETELSLGWYSCKVTALVKTEKEVVIGVHDQWSVA